MENKTTAKKKLQGIVIAKNSLKTIKVRVETTSKHPLYKKILKQHKNYLVHCEDDSVAIGDKVTIEEDKPVSKLKKYYLVKKQA